MLTPEQFDLFIKSSVTEEKHTLISIIVCSIIFAIFCLIVIIHAEKKWSYDGEGECLAIVGLIISIVSIFVMTIALFVYTRSETMENYKELYEKYETVQEADNKYEAKTALEKILEEECHDLYNEEDDTYIYKDFNEISNYAYYCNIVMTDISIILICIIFTILIHYRFQDEMDNNARQREYHNTIKTKDFLKIFDLEKATNGGKRGRVKFYPKKEYKHKRWYISRKGEVIIDD